MHRSGNTSILFFGTPEFALPALRALIDAGYSIVGVVTQPDKPVGRKRVLTSPPVKVLAERHGIPVYQPDHLDARDFAAGKIPRADLFVVAAYGKIIPKEILDLQKYGALNIHPSLLPRWRGPSPIQSAILAGDAKTGVTIMQMDEKMDHGPIVTQQEKPDDDFATVTYPILHNHLAEAGAKLLIETIPKWLSGAITPIPQNETKTTYCKLLTRNDGRIDWTKSAEEIERMIRAFHPWPGTWTIWQSESGTRRIRIEDADAIESAPPIGGAPGLTWQNQNHPLLIQTSRGSLAIKKLGIEGGNIIDAASFLRGHPSLIGATLI